MHIGLIGGIGPAATVAYYTRLIEVFKNENIPLEVTIVHANISTLTQNSGSDRRHEQAQVFARHIQQLKGAGCDIATITALTGHFCFEETEQLSELPLVNAITLIDEFCLNSKIQTLGLLGSPPVLMTKLFGLLKTPNTVVPLDGLDDLGKTYMDVAMSGICSEANRQKFITVGYSMIQDQNAEAVLLAGTDLGLAFNGQSLDYKVIDALEIHVAGLAKLASG
ncbi:aspartate/glutamate racemase family protein [Amylibacter sp. SFDW26]|uniref:aspartate/glutamate racemase family protein n=1 Tax=Amylibacter sp. SFDW26 TaxID=2652722 RepID=UPI001262884D|nr:aspartate/glutamate racemase family protein [Amylibacter sp. SFDW26]KAB7614254.1 aspartate/glutamate racemase family protein [Amylibacter sp. SFDW26]